MHSVKYDIVGVEMKIHFLGIGGWVSNPAFGQSAILIEEDNTKLLLDAGEGTYERLITCCRKSPCNLDYIVLTHRHGDHILGIPTLIQHAKLHGCKLRIITSNDVIKAVELLLESVGIRQYLTYIEFTEISGGAEIKLHNDLGIQAVRAVHPLPALSYIIKIGGKVIAYSGDTSPNSEFISAAKHADVLIHEVSGPDELRDTLNLLGHTSSADIASILEEVMPKYFIPVHYPLEAVYVHTLPSKVKLVMPVPCSAITIP